MLHLHILKLPQVIGGGLWRKYAKDTALLFLPKTYLLSSKATFIVSLCNSHTKPITLGVG